MPGDPPICDEASAVVLTAAYLLKNVAVKLPPFWHNNIKRWLVHTKYQLCLKGVTVSQTKFDHVVPSMSQNKTVKVLDLVCPPPHDNPYGHLNNCLLRMYGLTD